MIPLPQSHLICLEFQNSGLLWNEISGYSFINTSNITSITLVKNNFNIGSVDEVFAPCFYIKWAKDDWGYLTKESSYKLNKELGLGFKELEILILE